MSNAKSMKRSFCRRSSLAVMASVGALQLSCVSPDDAIEQKSRSEAPPRKIRQAVAASYSVCGETISSDNGSHWHVAPKPTGSVTNDGTADSPWTLQYAFDGAPETLGDGGQVNQIEPGDTVWLHGGTYDIDNEGETEGFDVTVSGTSSQKIVFRSLPWEWAVIQDNRSWFCANRADASACGPTDPTDNETIGVDGSYVQLRDLEVTNTATDRLNTGTKNFNRPNGVRLEDGDHNELVNVVIHDTGTGVQTASNAIGSKVYGSVIYNTGWDDQDLEDRGRGHGMYIQNQNTPEMEVTSNVIVTGYRYGLQLFKGSTVDSVFMTDNVLASTGVSSAIGGSTTAVAPIIIHPDDPSEADAGRPENFKLDQNSTWVNNDYDVGSIKLLGGKGGKFSSLSDNYLVGVVRWGNLWAVDSADMFGNTLFARGVPDKENPPMHVTVADAGAAGPCDLYNTFVDDHPGDPDAGAGNTYISYPKEAGAHCANPPKDEAGPPDTNVVRVHRANEYSKTIGAAAQRVHIAAYNWEDSQTITLTDADIEAAIDPADFDADDTYRIRNAYSYHAPPVKSGEHDGGSISVPLNGDTAPFPSLEPAQPIGAEGNISGAGYDKEKPGPLFGVHDFAALVLEINPCEFLPADADDLGHLSEADDSLTLVGGKVSAWPNDGGSLLGSLDQSTDSKRPTYDADGLAGAQTVVFDGTDDVLKSTLSKDKWRFLHDGSGATIVGVFRPDKDATGTNTIIDTNRFHKSPEPGISIAYYGGASKYLGLRVSNGTGTRLVDVNTTSKSVLQEETTVFSVRLKDGATNEYSIRLDQEEVKTGSFTGDPAVGDGSGVDPLDTLHVGSMTGSGGFPFDGHILALAIYDEYKSDAEVQWVERSLADKWQKPSLPSFDELKLHLEADHPGTYTVAADKDSAEVSAWPNRGDIGGDFDNDGDVSTSTEPHLVPLANRHAVLFDATADTLESTEDGASWKFLHGGDMPDPDTDPDPATIIGVIRPAAGATGVNVILDTNRLKKDQDGMTLFYSGGLSKRLALRVSNGSGTRLVDVDTATGSVPQEATTLFSVRLDDDETNQYHIRINGAFAKSGSFTGTPALDDAWKPAHVGGYSGGGFFFDGHILALLAYNDYLDDYELQAVERYLSEKWQ